MAAPMPSQLPMAFQWAFIMTNALVIMLGKDHLQVQALAFLNDYQKQS